MGLDKLNIPKGYQSTLSLIDTQVAIKLIKDTFERKLAENLELMRVSAPLFVRAKSGLNDTLSGVERSVKFDVLETNEDVEIVHSLAKWKRMALQKYGFELNKGLYTDMNAIRRDEVLDNIHSIYVDQWDWEKVISQSDRTEEYLKYTVRCIIKALIDTEKKLCEKFKQLKPFIEENITFIDSQDLYDMYPTLSSKEREHEIARKYHTVFISKIGDALSNGDSHDSRAPDYDDWQLNGDIIIYNPILDISFEISSMGIRVDEKSLVQQLEKTNNLNRLEYKYHSNLVKGKLPLTIGGGIGQSRLCMLLLQKAHIGEVQASYWSKETIELCSKNGIYLL